MKRTSALIFGILPLLFTYSFAFAHGGDEGRVSLEAEFQGSLTAGTISYGFQLFDTENNKTISNQDLVETHTKILHMIVYDSSLNEFSHVHPEFDGKIWTTKLSLVRNGAYFVWAQGQLTDGTEFSTFAKTQTTGGLPEIAPYPLGDHRKNSDRSTVIKLANTKIRAGQAAMVNFTISRDDGSAENHSSFGDCIKMRFSSQNLRLIRI